MGGWVGGGMVGWWDGGWLPVDVWVMGVGGRVAGGWLGAEWWVVGGRKFAGSGPVGISMQQRSNPPYFNSESEL